MSCYWKCMNKLHLKHIKIEIILKYISVYTWLRYCVKHLTDSAYEHSNTVLHKNCTFLPIYTVHPRLDNRVYNDQIQKFNPIFNFKLSFFKVKSRCISRGQSISISHIKTLIPSRSTRCGSAMPAHSPLVEDIAEKFCSINLAKHLGSECKWTRQAHLISWPDPLRPALLDLHIDYWIQLRQKCYCMFGVVGISIPSFSMLLLLQ